MLFLFEFYYLYSVNMTWQNFLKKPAVPKRWLFLISGSLWTGVGLLLNRFAAGWMINFQSKTVLIVIFIGMIIGLLITFFGFSRISKKNISRISKLPDPVCVFAFQEWENYLLVVMMMTIGIILRTTSFFPKSLLTPCYIGIGLALILSGIPYYRAFYTTKEN